LLAGPPRGIVIAGGAREWALQDLTCFLQTAIHFRAMADPQRFGVAGQALRNQRWEADA
jgi:hypothetical protein